METTKLRQALDEIIERCKAAGHRLHIFDPADIKYENVVGRGEEGIVQLCRVNYHGLEELSAIKVSQKVQLFLFMPRFLPKKKKKVTATKMNELHVV